MKPAIVPTLLILCVLADIALLGVILYDYYQNASKWLNGLLYAFAALVLFSAILFLLAGRRETKTVTETVVVRETTTGPTETVVVRETGPVVYEGMRPIPPAPIRALREHPPRRIPAAAPPVGSGIPFVYNGYTLFTKEVQLKNGGRRPIYFFSKRKPKSGRMCAKPLNYHVGVNERTGLPFLKKGGGADGEDLTPALAEAAYRPQCSALTEEGVQCRNSAREGSKYCAPHFGYQPPVLGKATVDRKDTLAHVKDAPDTKPSTRKSWFGRRKKSSA
jgi:hypothetical protein